MVKTPEMRLLILPGDGIGPEIMDSALSVLKRLNQTKNLCLTLEKGLIGGAAIDATGSPFPDITLNQARESHAILLAAVGGPQWDSLPSAKKPEAGLLKIRSGLSLFANLRPIKFIPELAEASTLKEAVAKDTDILIVRELTGGLYFGQPRGIDQENSRAFNTMTYSKAEITRIAHVAFQIAERRRKKLTSVDKANVLEVSRYWREIVNEVARQYPAVSINHLYVDNCALQLVLNPRQFDVILTENLFGDILSDEAAAIVGSLGLLPSASLSGNAAFCKGLFEPVHGSAPDLAGKDTANPLGMLYSTAMMLRYAYPDSQLGTQCAEAIEGAIRQVLKQGFRTQDLIAQDTPKAKVLKTSELTKEICKSL